MIMKASKNLTQITGLPRVRTLSLALSPHQRFFWKRRNKASVARVWQIVEAMNLYMKGTPYTGPIRKMVHTTQLLKFYQFEVLI